MSRAPRTELDPSLSAEYLNSWHATMKLLREGKSFSGRERNCAFLNCRDGRFADISFVSGFDYDDDGRAIAATDWDHDGDMDVWVTNRTGPRLRFLRNNTNLKKENNFVLIRLKGTTSNIDGIGARVQLVFDRPNVPPQMKTLYAGDAYLSQSSKWLHFGVASGFHPRSVVVRWPNGVTETFSNIAKGNRYLLTEGSANTIVRESSRSPMTLVEKKTLPVPSAFRTVLASRPTLPILRYQQLDADAIAKLPLNGKPVLLSIWASWCPTCQDELKKLAQHEKELRDAGVDVIALSVDRLQLENASTEDVRRIAQTFSSGASTVGYATTELIDKLRIMQRITLSQESPTVVPVHYWIDRQGQLALFYRGRLDWSKWREDLETLELKGEDRRRRAVPFAGIWTTPPRDLLLRPVAKVFLENGYQEDFERFQNMEMQRLESMLKRVTDEKKTRQLKMRYAAECFNLARSVQMQNRDSEAIEYYQLGLQIWNASPEAHFFLGTLQKGAGNQESALKHFRETVRFDPDHLAAHLELANAAALSDKPDVAMQHFQQVVRIQPKHVIGWTNLGVMYARMGAFESAEDSFNKAIQWDAQNFQALMNLGKLKIQQQHLESAVDLFRKATNIQPNSAIAFSAWGKSLIANNEALAASVAFEEALQRAPNDFDSMARLAWIYATSWNEKARNGDRALELAKRLNQRTEFKNAVMLDLLAVAYAEVGDFGKAIEFSKKAFHVTTDEQPNLKRKIITRAKMFEERKAYRETKDNENTN